MTLTIYLVRHGQVLNPDGIIYGHLPGYGLSTTGQAQIEAAAQALGALDPFDALYASPLQRAQESAAILAERLNLPVTTEAALVETGIGGYQGKLPSALPQPYITETPTHEGIESAASIRQRVVGWAEAMQAKHPNGQIIAVSHRDPIGVALFHWMGKGLDELPTFALETGSVFKVGMNNSSVDCNVILSGPKNPP